MGVNSVLFFSEDPASDVAHDAVRRCAGRWGLTYATSAAQALVALTERSFDVVIAEVSRDRAEGLEVLAQVKADRPEAARIVLSDPIDSELIQRALTVAHQCVAKPCEPVQFWRVVERTCFLHGLMGNRAIRGLLGGLERLPSVPRSYVALTQALGREDVELAEIVAIVEKDTAMATKVLQLVNSAFFGRPRRITSIPVTVSLLGFERMKALALGTHVFGMLSDADSRAYGIDRLQERSLLSAQLARRFLSGTLRADEGFTVGLLLDIGKLLLAVCLKDRYRDVLEQARRRNTTVDAIEREQFEVSHAVVGACMLAVWGLPATIIEAVAFHHAPGGVLHGDTMLVDAVHVADAMADAILDGRIPQRRELALDPILMSRDGMEERFRAWRALAAEELPTLPA
jgi:HD-like signal output (HDOD) protein